MAVKVEAFLALEASLTDRLRLVWQKTTGKTLVELDKAVLEQDWAEADRLIGTISTAQIGPVVEAYARFIGKSALLFGATRTGLKAKDTHTAKTNGGGVMDKAITQLNMTLSATDQEIKRVSRKALDKAMREADETTTQKASVVTNVAETVDRAGSTMMQLVAGLQNSRLAAYGLLLEAQASGVTKYQVNEQLDNRICPVCLEMHQKTFDVQRAFDRLDSLLSITDPNELKFAAPWPKQDKDSLISLTQMSEDEIAAAGWDTPPYHPGCRGILVMTGDAPEIDVSTTTSTQSPRGQANPVADILAAGQSTQQRNLLLNALALGLPATLLLGGDDDGTTGNDELAELLPDDLEDDELTL